MNNNNNNKGITWRPWEQVSENQRKIKRDSYLDLAKEQRQLWNMRVTLIPIVIDALVRFIKGLERGLEELGIRGRIETIQSTAILRSATILTSVREIWGDLLLLRIQWNAISISWCEEHARSKMWNNNYYYGEKKYKYQDFVRELKKLRNMKVTGIPIVIGALGTVTKGLVQST